MSWSEFQLKIIKSVKENPVLYNKAAPEYHNQQTRQNTWRIIAKSMHVKAKKCYNTWNHIRADYVTAINKNSTNSPKWKEMYFLKRHISLRKKDKLLISNNLNVPKLIKAIKKYPVLYDPKNKLVAKEVKSLSWENVSKEVMSDPKPCEAKWTYLIGQYREELLKHGEKSSKWPYFKHLSFLKEQILSEKSKELSNDVDETSKPVSKSTTYNDENTTNFTESTATKTLDCDDNDDDAESISSNEVYDIDFWSRSNDIEYIPVDKIKTDEIPEKRTNALDQNSCNTENIESFKIFLQNKLVNFSRGNKNKAMLDIMEYLIGIEMEVHSGNMNDSL